MTTKMPVESSALPAQTEKPPHYMYLKEFRTQQCPLFLQHKCTQHRPFTCFHWHFMNQRRRRPIRKRDGTFNYSPDVYCTKFDETSGMCPDGDDCPFLHRTAGDTERRYHLRYYKTGTCVYETDTKGNCVKNGPHCAFAHGALDLRPPAYDIRELQTIDTTDLVSGSPGTPCSGSLEKDRMLIEDPRWNDTNFVLANYKTETCKRSPRQCRQGYACPQFHNTRDRRRSPKLFKYRSTPCPNVKHGDDWGDPVQCENGDNCGYCHTRTEQQFHPEIYKSTKCNDMVQTNCCPRGPFCAFAHVEHEITTQRDMAQSTTLLATMISNLLPQSSVGISIANPVVSSIVSSLPTMATFSQHIPTEVATNGISTSVPHRMPDPIGKERSSSSSVGQDVQVNGSHGKMPPVSKVDKPNVNSNVTTTNNSINSVNNGHSGSPLPEPIGKGRSNSASSGSSIMSNEFGYHRAPGSEREDMQSTHDLLTCYTAELSIGTTERSDYGRVGPWSYRTIHGTKLRQQLQAIDSDMSIDAAEKTKRKQNLMMLHNLAVSGGQNTSTGNVTSSGQSNISTSLPSPMSPFAPAFYPPRETVGSVIEQALEDITLDDIDIHSLDKELDNDTNSLSSSISAGISSSGFGSSSIPIGIPPGTIQRGSVGSLSQSPPSPYGSFPLSILPLTNQQKDSHTDMYLGQYNHTKFCSSPFGEVNSMSPRSGPGGPHSPLYSHSVSGSSQNNSQNADVQKLQGDLYSCRTKLEHWEQAYNQAKTACEAWKKEAEDSSRKMKTTEDEKLLIVKQRDEALNQFKKVKMESSAMKTGGIRLLQHTTNELDILGLPQLCQIQQQLRSDLERLEQMIYKQTAVKCVICQDRKRSVATVPCNHCVMCDKCAATKADCPLCRVHITRRNAVNYQL